MMPFSPEWMDRTRASGRQRFRLSMPPSLADYDPTAPMGAAGGQRDFPGLSDRYQSLSARPDTSPGASPVFDIKEGLIPGLINYYSNSSAPQAAPQSAPTAAKPGASEGFSTEGGLIPGLIRFLAM